MYVFARVASHLLPQVFNGVCTTYMQQLALGASVDVFVRVSKFKLPKQLNCPIIMIGISPTQYQTSKKRDVVCLTATVHLTH